MNNPFYYIPSEKSILASNQLKALIAQHADEWREELSGGKMFGILIAEDADGAEHALFAYSGQISGRSDWDGFVPAVFDYLQEDGYFKREEANIVNINKEIERTASSVEMKNALSHLSATRQQETNNIEAFRRIMSESKARRNAMRNTADTDALIRESQFQKAELRRIKKRAAERISEAESAVEAFRTRISEMKDERRRRSDALQHWLFEHFVMLNGKGERKNLIDIFAEWAEEKGSKCTIPPAGSGECCAPKLLQYAFLNHLRPTAIAEFWYQLPGESATAIEGRTHGRFYGACQAKCAPVLSWMLKGVDFDGNPLESEDDTTTLEVLYEDDSIIAVNKPAGMLSVPGKSSRRSAYDILRAMRPDCPQLMMAHRLDMQTSGVLVAAKDIENYRRMQTLFAEKTLRKVYYALLEAPSPLPLGTCGTISLPLSADYLNRPMQRVDKEKGKAAVTEYEILDAIDGKPLVRLTPLTGRTHQLRVHCAHPEGLGTPILGDDLYGTHADRLYLHAAELRIGELTISAPIPFAMQ